MTIKLRNGTAAIDAPAEEASASTARKAASRATGTPGKWMRRFVVCGVVVVALWFFRAPLLQKAAAAWIVDERVAKVDAVVVLGGGLDSRPFKAADYFKAEVASKILVANTETNSVQQLGLQQYESDQVSAILTNAGVPAQAISRFGENVSSTRDEAVALRAWVRTNQIHSVLIPTDPFHTRRVKWLFEKTLAGTGVKVSTAVIHNKRYSATNWWTKEEGLVSFQNEVLKYGYYRWHY